MQKFSFSKLLNLQLNTLNIKIQHIYFIFTYKENNLMIELVHTIASYLLTSQFANISSYVAM